MRPVIDGALRERRTWLDPVEITPVLVGLFASRSRPPCSRAMPDEAVAAATPHLAKDVPVVLKIQSPDIVHKSEVGGVRLNLTSERRRARGRSRHSGRARAAKPDARIAGVTVFPMIVRPKARELIVGVADDPTFGPVIAFGQGGTAVEVISDKALALPPLDLAPAPHA